VANQVLCDRCGVVVVGAGYQLAGGKFERGADLCRPCYRAFEDFMQLGKPSVPRETPAAHGVPSTCPHGFTGHACAVCAKAICNLCGLYSAGGREYCRTHKPEHALTAR